MAKTVKLVRREGYTTWEWSVLDMELTPEMVKEINENYDGEIYDWAEEKGFLDDMEVTRDKINQNDYDVYFETEDSNGEVDWDELSNEVLGVPEKQ